MYKDDDECEPGTVTYDVGIHVLYVVDQLLRDGWRPSILGKRTVQLGFAKGDMFVRITWHSSRRNRWSNVTHALVIQCLRPDTLVAVRNLLRKLEPCAHPGCSYTGFEFIVGHAHVDHLGRPQWYPCGVDQG